MNRFLFSRKEIAPSMAVCGGGIKVTYSDENAESKTIMYLYTS